MEEKARKKTYIFKPPALWHFYTGADTYGIVKQHGGNIWAYSEMGYGSVFKIYLPIPDDAKAEGHKEIRKAPKPEVNGSETILLVEDEVIVQEMVVSMLKLQGYKVLTAEKGEGAIELLTSHENQVHLLLTDVVMPDMNGLELYDKLSKICPELKVIYMSGYTRDVIAYHGMLDAGVNFLQKPFSVNDLALKIREVLAG